MSVATEKRAEILIDIDVAQKRILGVLAASVLVAFCLSCFTDGHVPATPLIALSVLWASHRSIPSDLLGERTGDLLAIALWGAPIASVLVVFAGTFLRTDSGNPYPLRSPEYATDFLAAGVPLVFVLWALTWRVLRTAVGWFESAPRFLAPIAGAVVFLCACVTVEATVRAVHAPDFEKRQHLQTLPLLGVVPAYSETNGEFPRFEPQREPPVRREVFSFGSFELVRRCGNWCSFIARPRGERQNQETEHASPISLSYGGGYWGLRSNERLNVRRDDQSQRYVVEGRGWPVAIFSQQTLEELPVRLRFTHLASAPHQWLPGAWGGLLFSLYYLSLARRRNRTIAVSPVEFEEHKEGYRKSATVLATAADTVEFSPIPCALALSASLALSAPLLAYALHRVLRF